MPTLAPETIATECEKQFQNGGPKLYRVDCENNVLACYAINAKTACVWCCPDEWVAARRKVGREYKWVVAGKGAQQ